MIHNTNIHTLSRFRPKLYLYVQLLPAPEEQRLWDECQFFRCQLRRSEGVLPEHPDERHLAHEFSERDPDADAPAIAVRRECHRVPPRHGFRGEPFRVKLGGVWVVLLIVVNADDGNLDVSALGEKANK